MAVKNVTNKPLSCNVFTKEFVSQKLSTLYLVYGNEEYLKNRTADMIIDRAIPKNSRDFDYIVLYGDDMTPYDAVSSFSTKPFLSDNKVVLIRKFDSLKATDQQKIIDEFEKTSIDNILVLTAEKFDTRLKTSKKILEIGKAVQCKNPYKAEEMIPWLNEEAKYHGKRFDPQAALLFVNKVELDFYYAANELEKLVLYCHDKATITLSDVQLCTGDSKTHNIFDFINSVGDKDVRQSFIVMENLMENKEAPVFIITMLLRFFVQMWRINALRATNLSDYAITNNHLKDIHVFFRKNYLTYSRNYPLRMIPRIFNLLLETDTELKSVSLNESLLIERMLFRLFALK